MNCGTILYVEDDENDVMFMRQAWKKAGQLNPIYVVTDGEQAMHYLAGEGIYANREEYPMPFLVLLDLKLPKVSGLEVLKWIREQPAIHTLRVIILTSSNQPMDIHTAHALRTNAYLIKPADSDGLGKMVASLQDFWMSKAQTPPECSQFKK